MRVSERTLDLEKSRTRLAEQVQAQAGRLPDVVIVTHAGGGNLTGTARGLRKATESDCLVCHSEKGSHVAVLKQPPLDMQQAWREIRHPTPRDWKYLDAHQLPPPASSAQAQYTGVMACGQCHPNAANTHPETYPKFQQQLGRVVALRDMINWCLQNPLEGQPLEGDFGSWRVSRVEPRSAVLESASGDQVRLELQIHDAIIDEPPKPRPASSPVSQETSEQAQDDAPMSRAEEIRQRIAERREELRRQQEEGSEPTQPAAPSYQQAIEALMKGRQQDTTKQDESEQ